MVRLLGPGYVTHHTGKGNIMMCARVSSEYFETYYLEQHPGAYGTFSSAINFVVLPEEEQDAAMALWELQGAY